MPCFNPMRVATDEDGHLDWSKSYTSDVVDSPVLVPCRNCIGCKLADAREWAIRCFHEATLHTTKWKDPRNGLVTEVPNSSMVTLTYDNEHLPADGCLDKGALVNFHRRLDRHAGRPVRRFSIGEYGTTGGRPHYHALLMGLDLDDRYQVVLGDGQLVSKSHTLDKLWPFGNATIDDLNFNTVRYVSGYLAKEKSGNPDFVDGPIAEKVDPTTGTVVYQPVQPQFRLMSRQPGLASEWIKANYERVYPFDEITIHGISFPPPGYYDRWLRREHPDLYAEVQTKRYDQRIQSQVEWTPQRLHAAEIARLQTLRKDKN